VHLEAGNGVHYQFNHYLRKIVESKNPLKHVLGDILYYTKLCKYFTFEKGNLRFRFYPSTMLSCLWKDHACYDKDLAFYKLFLKPGDIFVDVGANIGLISLTAAQIVGQKGIVISIEGFPKTYYCLDRIIDLNRFLNVKSYNYIIGSENTYASFVEKIDDDSQNYVYNDENGKIPVRRLDNIIDFLDHIDLLKIDVEGYEKFALLGATKILDRVTTIYFEMSQIQYSRYNYGLDEIIDILERFNFTIFSLRDDDKTIRPIKKGYAPEYENLIATRDCQNLLNRTNLRISVT
jgi:FkbM family methyltransferase